MSKLKVHGYTVHVPEDGWRFDCDVPNCIRFISIYRDGHVIDGTRFRSELHQLVCGVDDAETAFDLGVVKYGWQRGDVLDRLYCCPEHREDADS